MDEKNKNIPQNENANNKQLTESEKKQKTFSQDNKEHMDLVDSIIKGNDANE